VGDVLPIGAWLLTPEALPDERGTLTELFRYEWLPGVEPVQWNLVENRAHVLRGVHLHVRHTDVLTIVAGRMLIGWRDLRTHSTTAGASGVVELASAARQVLVIPPGVAHGFYFPAEGTHLYAVDTYWDPSDEFGCRWDDGALEIPWTITVPIVSERDASAGSLADLLEQIEPHQAQFNV
jgi:dTDP-4-dehydrorhamnose 3,5-epimerase